MRHPFKLPQHLTKSFTTQPRDCGQTASPVLGDVGTAGGAGDTATGKPVPCSRSYGDVKSGPDVTAPGGGAQLGASNLSPPSLNYLTSSTIYPATMTTSSTTGRRHYNSKPGKPPYHRTPPPWTLLPQLFFFGP